MKKIVFTMFLSFISLFAFEELTMDNFDSKIKDKNVIIDFYASWCPPCRIIGNNLENFDVSKPENVHIYKVNVDDELALAKKYGVSKLPTVIYFKNGKPVKEYVGVLSVEELAKNSKENFK